MFIKVSNSNHENISGYGRVIFRAVMNMKRFGISLAVMRFDNPNDRN